MSNYGRDKLKALTAEDLRRLYVDEQLSQWEIAERFGVTQGAILYWMRKWGIQSRDMTAARRAAMAAGRNSGPRNGTWKGGRTRVNGYVLVKAPGHPRTDGRGYVREHIIVWEQANRASLPPGWHVHHKNGVKDDNRPENLEAMPRAEHRDVIPELLRRIGYLEERVRRLSDELDACRAPNPRHKRPDRGSGQPDHSDDS